MEHLSNSIKETNLIAKEFIKSLDNSKDEALIVSLYGDLGSGKTTFVKGVGNSLGIKEEVVSPTFIIERVYKLKNKEFKFLIHIDAYRLESGDEILKLGWKEIVSNKENLIFIEWPEKIKSVLPKDSVKIYFEFIDENKRKIKIENAREK